jgi:chromosome partitioning protein
MTKIICFINHKGGVGKTTSTVNIGAGLAMAGARVLLVDLDPQCNLSESLGIVRHEPNIYDTLVDKKPLTILPVKENLAVVPSSLRLAAAEIQIAQMMSRETLLKKALRTVKKDYDFILIDCPPSLGLLPVNALVAADEVIIPLEAEFLAYRGLDSIIEVINLVRSDLNEQIIIGGVFMTMFNPSRTLTKTIRTEVEKMFGAVLFNTVIRVNVALAEAPSVGKDIFAYAPDSAGARDYTELVKEILAKSQETSE